MKTQIQIRSAAFVAGILLAGASTGALAQQGLAIGVNANVGQTAAQVGASADIGRGGAQVGANAALANASAGNGQANPPAHSRQAPAR